MDTQINLYIKHIYLNDYQSRTKTVSFKLSEFYKLYSENAIFEFKEYDKVKIDFYCDDKSVTLKIESHYNLNLNYSQIEKDDTNDTIDENMLILKSGDSILLSPGGDSEDMLVPGKYSLKVLKNNICFEGFYSIIPNTLDWQAIINIKNYLEGTVKGLAYNIYLERKSRKNIETNLEQNIESYRYLYSNQDKLFNHMKYIIQNPILDIRKEYIKRDYSKKQDNKSQRWLSKKGAKYNQNILASTIFCEKNSYSTYETIENVFLKNIVSYMQNISMEAECEYIKILNSINKNIFDLQDKIMYKSNTYEEALKVPNTYNVNRIRQSQIEILEKEIYSYNEKKEITEKKLNDLCKFKGRLNYYINETWLKNIDSRYSKSCVTTRILKNYHYNEIYSIYNNLKKSNISGGFDLVFPYKKTSKLFEIYGFLITKDIFEELGFKWTQGWLKSNKLENIYNGDLVAGESITMEKENYKLIIAYDIYIGTPDELKNVGISQPSTKPDNQHRRPDILVSLYKDNKLLGCEVIEVKYRRKSNIYNTKGIDTDVCKQLSSYTGFDYYDAERGRVIREKPVYKVLTLYPKQDDLGQYKHNVYDIEFIPIMPDEDDASKYYGYLNLKNELKEFLDYFISE